MRALDNKVNAKLKLRNYYKIKNKSWKEKLKFQIVLNI